MRKLKAVKVIFLEFSVYGMERLLQCQQAGPAEITTTLRDRRGPANQTNHYPGGIDSAGNDFPLTTL